MTRRSLRNGALVLSPILAIVAATWAAAAPAPDPPAPADAPAVTLAKDVVPFLSKHCYACHGNGKHRGDLVLDRYRDEEAVQKDRKVWENVVEMVQTGEMPPKNRPRPAVEETVAALKAIDVVLARLDCNAPRNPGRVTLRRLNKAEYNNTIRDLAGVDFKPAEDFPNDDVGYGFDNIGDVLSLSPLLLEKYLAAAETVLDQAIVIAEPPKPATVRLGNLRVSFGAGEIVRRRGARLDARGTVSAERFLEEGDYRIRVEAYARPVDEEPARGAIRIGREVVEEFDVTGDESDPVMIEVKRRLKTGTIRLGVAFLNPSEGGEGAERDAAKRALFVRRIEVDGPYNPPPPVLPESHRRIMAHTEGVAPREAAREIVARFAPLAFRRPVADAEVDRLLLLYDRAEKDGGRFEDCVRLALARVLTSPHFLFRVELDPRDAAPGASYPVGEYELASRLSYFLWSSMPDDALFGLAARGALRSDLEGQVRRMARDPKSAAFVENFAGQWLTLRKLDYVAPDPSAFPGFDEELRAAMRRETELFFEAVVREDRSVLDLLDADFSFINARLAKHYGIAGVEGKAFRRVTLPPNRGGILTQASILTLTSHPTRTSPVKRGKWVLDQILNTPPPPPPPDVPALAEERHLTGTLRQVMEQHRDSAICASCHKRMDPIGFAFENYDAVGAWRDKDGTFAIDPSGTLPDGRSFRGPAELKGILKGKKDAFARCLVEKLLTYAIGRGLESYDRCAVDAIVGALSKDDYTFSTLLVEVVKSEPFQLRTATRTEP